MAHVEALQFSLLRIGG